jgi:hypothetical protein
VGIGDTQSRASEGIWRGWRTRCGNVMAGIGILGHSLREQSLGRSSDQPPLKCVLQALGQLVGQRVFNRVA